MEEEKNSLEYVLENGVLSKHDGTEKWDIPTVYLRSDGSFIVKRINSIWGNNLYHVPNFGEWEEMHGGLADYVKQHPETIQDEPVNTPTEEELKAAKLSGINTDTDRTIATLTVTE